MSKLIDSEQQNKLHLPRVMLAAPSSGSGKTMITCGLLQALMDRKKNPASFKCGPDYIDPMFHSRVIGAKSRNLDTFFTDKKTTRYLFARTAKDAGISVLEGVMGIFDGLGGISEKASSYDLACVTDTPVILIVNARGMSLSVIPMIKGYLDYQKKFGKEVIAGVILNQTTKMTYLMLKKMIEEELGIKALGYVPRLSDCIIESRHLGLVTPDEITDLKESLQRLSKELEASVDLDGLLELAESAADYDAEETIVPWDSNAERLSDTGPELERDSKAERSSDADPELKIAVAMDEAFCFYYQDNLELLEMLGAAIIPFSPIWDKALPKDCSGLILGGGYPELYAKQLSENLSMLNSIRSAIDQGMPYLAECGGFMYLHESMEDMTGTAYSMCGVIKGSSYKTEKLGRFGYITLNANEDGQILHPDQTIRGHEFHYFDSTNAGEAYHAGKPTGKRAWECIHGDWHCVAGYPHLYYWSNPEFAGKYLDAVRKFREET